MDEKKKVLLTQQALLELFGITDKYVSKVTVVATAKGLPEVTIEYHPIVDDGVLERKFELNLKEEDKNDL